MSNAALKRIHVIEEEIFKGVPSPKVGSVYLSLIEHFPLKPIQSSKYYSIAKEVAERIVVYLNEHARPSDSLSSDMREYLTTLATLIEQYEQKEFPGVGKASGGEMLAYLMELHSLKQTDLEKELGGQSVVSAILRGKRDLNLGQIKALAKRFHVSPIVFLS